MKITVYMMISIKTYTELKFKKIIFNITSFTKDEYEKRTQNNIMKWEAMFNINYYKFTSYYFDNDDNRITIDIISFYNLRRKRNAPIYLDVKINENKYSRFFELGKIRYNCAMGDISLESGQKIK